MKKLNLFWSVLFVLNYFSCSDKIYEQPDSDNTKKLKSGGDGIYDLLGYGCDPTAPYLVPQEQTKMKVIDVERLILEQSGAYNHLEPNTTFLEVIGGSDALNWSDSLRYKSDGSLPVKLLTASINKDVSVRHSISSRYSYAAIFMKICKKRMILYHSKDVLKNYLTSDFINDLNIYPSEEIIRRYGTHIYTDISIGGKLEIDYKSIVNSDTKKLTVSAGAKCAADKVFNFGVSANGDLALSSSNTYVTCSYRSFGGDPGKIMLGEIKDNTLPLTDNLSAWSSTISLSNSEIIDIGDRSLIPIYELIPDPAKAEQFRVASNEYLRQHSPYIVNASIRCSFALTGSYDKAISLDYDGDGTKDILFFSPGNRIVCLNGGFRDGTFENVFTSSYGLSTYDFSRISDQVVALDFNGDKRDDLMCYRPGDGYVHLLKSNGDGTFTSIYANKGFGGYNFDTPTDKAITLDYNGDHKADLMFFRPGKKIVFLLRGNGDGTFTTVSRSYDGFAGYNFDTNTDLAISLDYNNDGYDDILCYRPGKSIVFLQKSNGNGTFTTVYASYNGLAGYNFDTSTDKAISLDYNGDGFDDLMCYRPGSGYVYLLRSNGNAQFAVIYQNRGIVGYDLSDVRDRIISMDYNNDGLSDIILYRPGIGYAYAASSNGSGYNLDYKQLPGIYY